MHKSAFDLSRYSFIQILTLSIVLLTLFVLTNIFSNQVLDIRSSAKQNISNCREQYGGVCMNEKDCSESGGYNLGVRDCAGNTICCYLGD